MWSHSSVDRRWAPHVDVIAAHAIQSTHSILDCKALEGDPEAAATEQPCSYPELGDLPNIHVTVRLSSCLSIYPAVRV